MKLLLEAWKGYLASTKPIPQQDPNYPEEEEDVYWRSEGEQYDDEEEPPARIEDLETAYFGKDRRDLTKICKTLRLNFSQNNYLNVYELQRFAKALGNKLGIERYGFCLPMDDCLAQVAIDFGGRNWLVWETEFKREMVGKMPTEMFYHFFKSFSDGAVATSNSSSGIIFTKLDERSTNKS